MSLPLGMVLFADEIRQEVTAKYFIIGMYTQDIVFFGDEMPAAMSRLAVLCFLKWPDVASVEPVTIEFYAPQESDDAPPGMVTTVDPAAVFATPREDRTEPGIMVAQSFENIPMGQEGSIRVFVSGPSGRARIGRARVLTQRSLEAMIARGTDATAVPQQAPAKPARPRRRRSKPA